MFRNGIKRGSCHPANQRYWYLDMTPKVRTSGQATWKRKELLNWGPVRCFAQDDLYTVQWGTIEDVDLERLFFGRIDGDGKQAVEYFAAFEHPNAMVKHFQAFLRYMSVQKPRTPKGLGYVTIFALGVLRRHTSSCRGANCSNKRGLGRLAQSLAQPSPLRLQTRVGRPWPLVEPSPVGLRTRSTSGK
jgi:hypothetical protein